MSPAVDAIERPLPGTNSDSPATGVEESKPGAPTAASQDSWQPEDRAQIDKVIDDALQAHNGNVHDAWESLVAKRHDPKNFYDHNLADAADSLRARWEVERYGPEVEKIRVDAYLELKQHGLIPQAGPGPVSPYSDIQREYMHKGIAAGLADLKADGKEPPNPIVGAARAAKDGGISGEGGIEEGSAEVPEHGAGEHRGEGKSTSLLEDIATQLNRLFG